MPLRAFGGRAAGGALGLQHGNIVTDPAGNITVLFPVPFGAVPDIIAVVFDGVNNYTVTIRTRNALGFTAHVRQLTPQVSGASTVQVGQLAGTAVPWNYDVAGNLGHTFAGNLTLWNSSHTHATSGDQAAAPGVTVMWMAVA